MSWVKEISINFWQTVKGLPAKNQVQILLAVIIMVSGYFYYRSYLDYKYKVTIATIMKPIAIKTEDKENQSLLKVDWIENKSPNIKAKAGINKNKR